MFRVGVMESYLNYGFRRGRLEKKGLGLILEIRRRFKVSCACSMRCFRSVIGKCGEQVARPERK